MHRARNWTPAITLTACAVAAIAALLTELANASPAVAKYSAPTEAATSPAISWILLVTLALIALIRPWSYGAHNYAARAGLGVIAWICSGSLLLLIMLHAPSELRILGLWHLSVLTILVLMLFEGMIRVALGKRRCLARAHLVSTHRAMGASDTTLYAVARPRPGLR